MGSQEASEEARDELVFENLAVLPDTDLVQGQGSQ